MQLSLRNIVAIATISASALVPALAAPAMASPSSARSSLPAATTPALVYGSHGAAVKKLQQQLLALHYYPGKIDGDYGPTTSQAVDAFQRVNGISPVPTRVGPQTQAALAHPRTPAPLVPKGAKNRAEVSIKKQLLFIYKNGKLVLISHVSTGSETYYVSGGRRQLAHTPRGTFKVYRKAKGWETSPLGKLYKASYFIGGYAVHGEPAVPDYPASHGCVRVPMGDADLVASLLPLGTAVYILSS